MGDAARNLDGLLADAAGASERAMVARDDARGKAVAAIRQLEAKLQAAIAGDTLRGMASLTEGSDVGFITDNGVTRRQFSSPLQGARVRGAPDAPIKHDQGEVLVLSRDGELLLATRHHLGWSARPAGDDELQAQDLALFAKVLQTVLARHVARAARTADSYDRVARLSARLAAAVGWV